ncbi:MAG TPA: PKD domain-containing protein [Pyrinomonadaceae bacterium]
MRETLIGGRFGVRIIGGREVYTEGVPTDTTLAPGQTVQVLISDLGVPFGTRMDDGSYELTARYSATLQAQASFNVALVETQSVPVLDQMAASGDESAQRWANSYLDLIRKPSISGRITDSNGPPVGGVLLSITGAGFTNQSNLSDGTYVLSPLVSGGSYTITPSLKGYTFEPMSLAFSNLTTKQVNANFTATKGAAGDSVALESGGATVTASSTFDEDFRADGAINGSTHGDWGTGSGGWMDGTPAVFPDSIEVNFGSPKGVDWINVYTLQDNFQNSTEPTLTETFTLYGITDFDVQYWNGTTWVNVPGGQVNGNKKVWRKFTFPTITTSKIRVVVRNALASHSRITEIEAFHTNKPPTVSISGTYQGAPGANIQFNSSAADSDGSISNYDWDFGDNTSGTGSNPSHTYALAGTYTVTLTVTDDSGQTATATKTVSIAGPPQAPIASAGGPYTGFPGMSIILDGRGSFDPDGAIVSYQWDFGDGTSAPGAAPSHTYAQTGTYSATLVVTDNSGSTASQTAIAIITTGQPAKPSQTITFNAPANKTYGDAPFAPSALSSSNLAVTFSVVSGPATISGSTVTITGAGRSRCGRLNPAMQTTTPRRTLTEHLMSRKPRQRSRCRT